MDPIVAGLLLGALLLARAGLSGRGLGRARALPDVGAEDLDPGVIRRIQFLADRVGGAPILITSGYRSGFRQARAMIAKLERGEDLRQLYRSAAADGRIDALLSLPRDPAIWGPVLDDWAARGRSISDHMTRKAVDLRIWDWSASQYDRVEKEARRLGFRALREADHLHLEL